jgi:hypothetical protein
MNEVQCGCHIFEPALQFTWRAWKKAAGPELLSVPETTSVQVLQDRKRNPLVFSYIQRSDDVRVDQLQEGAYFSGKTASELGIFQHGPARDFDHNVAL